jgi:thioredoxin 1
MASPDVITFTDSNFQNEVLSSSQPVLVDFWAVWCGPCRAIAPFVDELASEYKGKAKVGKLNVDENQGVAAKFGIRSIPTLLLFNDGKVVDQVIGVQPKAKLSQMIDKTL